MKYSIKTQYEGLSITKQVMGLGSFTLNTNIEYTQEQLRNYYNGVFKDFIDVIDEDIHKGKDLTNMSYNDLYDYAIEIGLTYNKRPKKELLIEDIINKENA